MVVIGKERLLTWVENYTSLCYIHFYSTLICNDQRISFLIYIYIYQKFAMEILSSVAQSENLCSHAVCSRLTSRLQCLLYHVFHVFHVFPLRKGMKTHVKNALTAWWPRAFHARLHSESVLPPTDKLFTGQRS